MKISFCQNNIVSRKSLSRWLKSGEQSALTLRCIFAEVNTGRTALEWDACFFNDNRRRLEQRVVLVSRAHLRSRAGANRCGRNSVQYF